MSGWVWADLDSRSERGIDVRISEKESYILYTPYSLKCYFGHLPWFWKCLSDHPKTISTYFIHACLDHQV